MTRGFSFAGRTDPLAWIHPRAGGLNRSFIPRSAAVRRLGPRTLDHFEWGLAALAPVEAPAVAKMEALALVNGLAALFAGGGGTASGPEALSGISPTRHQHLVAALGAAGASAPPADLFERALTSLLTGLLGATGVRPSRPGDGERPPATA